jgi:hypothetical protein
VLGKSGDIDMSPGRIDPSTGRVVTSGGTNIFPDHIVATVLASAGVSAANIRMSPIQSILA